MGEAWQIGILEICLLKGPHTSVCVTDLIRSYTGCYFILCCFFFFFLLHTSGALFLSSGWDTFALTDLSEGRGFLTDV